MNALSESLRPEGGTIQDYADAKSSVVEEIISQARGDQKHER
jgi:hypothetical protein